MLIPSSPPPPFELHGHHQQDSEINPPVPQLSVVKIYRNPFVLIWKMFN